MNSAELKQLCLQQLQSLSDSAIFNIINGLCRNFFFNAQFEIKLNTICFWPMSDNCLDGGDQGATAALAGKAVLSSEMTITTTGKCHFFFLLFECVEALLVGEVERGGG